MEITVKVENVYGNPVVYPVCEKAKLFAIMAGTKTLTSFKLAVIKELGYKINVEQAQLAL